jgi:hypothetical protein
MPLTEETPDTSSDDAENSSSGVTSANNTPVNCHQRGEENQEDAVQADQEDKGHQRRLQHGKHH